MASKFALTAKTKVLQTENEKLNTENIALTGATNEMRILVENQGAELEDMKARIVELETEIEVTRNDKEAVEGELERSENNMYLL